MRLESIINPALTELYINVNLQVHRRTTAKLLNIEKGIKTRKRQCCEVESVFANIKQNHDFCHFMLQCKEKMAIEYCQNIRMKAA
ncbi:transposase [Emticicia fontis]